MRRRTFLGVVLTASALLVLSSAVTTTQARRVLFVGNSYTYFNNLPEMVRQLAEASGAGPVEVRMAAFGGGRLRDHWEKGEARTALAEGKWDYVVLQEQSTLGVEHLVDGRPRVSNDSVFAPAAQRWAEAITKAGAKPVFYLTWARKATPEDQGKLTDAYTRAAKKANGILVPAGIAWASIRAQGRGPELFVDDGSHPGPAGTYLTACTMVAALFGKDPQGLPAKLMGPPVNLETERVEKGKSAVLVELSAADAARLQAAAWKAWKESGLGR